MLRSLAVLCGVLLLRAEGSVSEDAAAAAVRTSFDDGGASFDASASLLTKLRESPSRLRDLAKRAKDILDRISRNWALEGARAIQNGEIRLRRLYKNVGDKIEELVTKSAMHGRHVMRCLNKTMFETEMDGILDETTNCYSRSLESVHGELKRIEDHQNVILEKMDGYARRMLAMLSDCFRRESSADVVACLRRVDDANLGSEMRHREAADLAAAADGAVGKVSAAVSTCTAKGLADTEAHVRKGYARSLTCLKEHP